MTAQKITKSLVVACAAGFAVAGTACVDSKLEPRSPDAVVLTEPAGGKLWIPEGLPTAGTEDTFWQLAARESQRPPRHVPARSISLGFIGDEPIGAHGTPPHYEQAWPRPFPPQWTRSYHAAHTYGVRGLRW